MNRGVLALIAALSIGLISGCTGQTPTTAATSPSPVTASAATATEPRTIAPAPSALPPSSRIDPAVAFDSENGQLVVFGGFDSSNSYLGDTWLWNGTWSLYSGIAPPGRRFAAMAWDPARNEGVLYGGSGACQPSCTQLHDTWLWKDSSWQQANPTHIPMLSTAVTTYDPSGGSILMFGFVTPDCQGGLGVTCPSAPPSHAETWKWDGSDWSLVRMLDPSSPMQHLLGYQIGMAHDPITGKIILLGHVDSQTPNTWAWDGSNWSLIGTVGTQGYVLGISEDATARAVIAVDPFATWSWDGQRWNRLSVSGGPGDRQEFGIAYDDHAGRVLVFGGLLHLSNGTDQFMNDLWSWYGQSWTEL